MKLTVMFYMFHPLRLFYFVANTFGVREIELQQNRTQAILNISRYWALRLYGKAFYFPITTVAQTKYFGTGFIIETAAADVSRNQMKVIGNAGNMTAILSHCIE